MDLDALRPADLGSLAAVALSLVVGLVALPALPGEVAIQWAANGSPNTVLPTILGVLLTPTVALLAFASLRGGALLPGRDAELRSTTGLAVVAGGMNVVWETTVERFFDEVWLTTADGG